MAEQALQIDDDGFLSVSLGGSEQEIDAYAVWNEIIDTRQRCADEDRAGAFLGEVVKVLHRVGFARVSHYAADRFVVALNQVVDRLGKAVEAERTPDSPSTTERAS